MAGTLCIWVMSYQNYFNLYQCVLILSTIIVVGIFWSEFSGLSTDDVARCIALLFNWSLSGQGIYFGIPYFTRVS